MGCCDCDYDDCSDCDEERELTLDEQIAEAEAEIRIGQDAHGRLSELLKQKKKADAQAKKDAAARAKADAKRRKENAVRVDQFIDGLRAKLMRSYSWNVTMNSHMRDISSLNSGGYREYASEGQTIGITIC
jgi:hypothetical protein